MDINVQNKIFWYTILVQGGGGRRGGGMLTSKLKKNIMSYIYSTTPNRYTLSQHNTIAGNVKFWLKTAEQREITPAPLYTGEPCCKYWGVTSMVMLCQDWSQQVEHMQVPKGRDQVSGVVGKYRFWDSSTREKTPATLCILWWGGQVSGGGRHRVGGMTMTDKWFRYPVYSQNPYSVCIQHDKER